MRLVVCGGAGFLGSHLVDRLLAEGHVVEVVDNLSEGSLANLAEARAATTGSFRFHHLDVRVPEMAGLLARLRPEVVVDLAGPPAGASARERLDVELLGTVNLLDAAVAAGVDKVVVGLAGVDLYGVLGPRQLPAKEGELGRAESVTTVAARAVVDLLAIYREQHALEYTALALGQVYGSRQRRGVVHELATAVAAGVPCTVHGDGRQTRDFVFVDDAVDAIVRASNRGSGLVINVGTGIQTSIRRLYDLLAPPDAPPPELTAALPGNPRFALSPVRARIHLGWAPWTSLEDGLAQLARDPAA